MKYVYVRRGDGLGTRILSIMQAKILADYLGYELRVVWPRILAPYYSNENLLSSLDLADVFRTNHFFASTEKSQGEIIAEESFAALDLVSVNSISVDDLAQRSRVDAIVQAKHGIIYGEPYQILTDDQLGLSVSARMKALWTSINWSDGFLKSVTAFEAAHNVGASIAVHARRGDIVTMLKDADLDYLHNAGMEQLLQRFVAVKSFLRYIAASAGDYRNIIVCGEDDGVANAISTAFKDKRVISTRTLAGSETKRAFMDLYILSKSMAVIAPYHSYFSGCAAILGYCQFQPIQLSVPEGLDEIFAMIDASGREDKVAVKSLACSTYGRMLSSGTRLTVTISLAH